METIQKGTRCIVYARVSSEKQATEEKSSLDNQIAECRRVCEERGYQVVTAFRDTVSRSTLDRPGLSGARQLIREGKADVLMAMVVDRLSGNQRNLYVLMHEVESYGARLEFAREEFEQTATGQFLLAVKNFTAELELERNSTRIRDGNRAKKLKGEPLGTLPMGFKREDKAAVEDPLKAPTVRRVFHLYANEQLSLGKIGDVLKAEGHTTAKNKTTWDETTLGRIIRNPRYMGKWPANQWEEAREPGQKPKHVLKPESEWIWHGGPALVDADTWHKANRILDDARQASPRRAKNPESFLLKADQLRCGICGRRMYGRSPRDDERGRSPYYQCVRKDDRSKEECKGVFISTKKIDPFVWGTIHDLLEDPERLVDWGLAQAEDGTLDKQIADTKVEAGALAEEHDKLTSRWLDAPESALPKLKERIDGLDKRLAQAEQRLETLEAQREELVGAKASFESWLADARERLDELTHKEKQQLTRDFGVQVTVYPEGSEHRWLLGMEPEVLLIGPQALEPGWYDVWNDPGDGPFAWKPRTGPRNDDRPREDGSAAPEKVSPAEGWSSATAAGGLRREG